LKADAALVFGRLKNTRRYKVDKAVVERLARQYPAGAWDWYVTGDSFGEAVVTQLQRNFPFLKSG
jgi:hypothetical protein